ncbi:hypothetical protein Athai_47300 [Actinocatenispora thailandica]|uniref:Uncharacterized protein n=1 Tax=Actinocatenispora thailandica TaxID=227318 RepID=A0A7R7HZ23_9ACTN|nr:hypothetical protein [Actinocatenispora thailandica]BCJ36889.1 hypothetical protein Athai_43920 [Actinocatenispora thailandica]BCJ37227.1 hypothetical protein Athai_47300 [Actinocatenispora thailandica]
MYSNPEIMLDLANGYQQDHLEAAGRARLFAARKRGGHRRTRRHATPRGTATVDPCAGGMVTVR